jgi:hypothetical protein
LSRPRRRFHRSPCAPSRPRVVRRPRSSPLRSSPLLKSVRPPRSPPPSGPRSPRHAHPRRYRNLSPPWRPEETLRRRPARPPRGSGLRAETGRAGRPRWVPRCRRPRRQPAGRPLSGTERSFYRRETGRAHPAACQGAQGRGSVFRAGPAAAAEGRAAQGWAETGTASGPAVSDSG